MRHLKIPAMLGGLAWSLQAMAQDSPIDPLALAPLAVDPQTAMLVSVLESGSLPMVFIVCFYMLKNSIGSWTPTVRIVHVRDNAPWDGVERRGSGR